MADSVDWDKGLPLGILSAVAGGRDDLKVMREVSHSWQEGFEGSVSVIKGGPGPALESIKDLPSRFPCLTSLLLWKHEMGQASLRRYSSLRKLSKLSLAEPDFVFGEEEQDSHLEHLWSESDLLDLCSMPALQDLTLSLHLISNRISSIRNLQGLKLTRLDLMWCSSLRDLDGLQAMPLTRLKLDKMDSLKDTGLESLRGLPLTHLDLRSCPLVTDVSLEVFRGMPLAYLKLDCLQKVTDAGLEVFRGMALTDLVLDSFEAAKGPGLGAFHGMPLRRLKLVDCWGLKPDACASLLEGRPLTELEIEDCGRGGMDRCLEVRNIVLAVSRWVLFHHVSTSHCQLCAMSAVRTNGPV